MLLRTILFGSKILLFSGLLLYANQAMAQMPTTNQARNLYWGFGGGGVSTEGGAVGLGASHQFRSHIISGRFVRSYDSDGGGTQSWDVGALYGRSYKTQYAMISGSAGVAYVGPSSTAGTVGLPLESQIFWTPTRYFGIGVYGFGNINSKQSFAGALLGLQLGRVTNPFVKH